MTIEELLTLKEDKIRKAKKDLFYYEHLLNPDFFKRDRPHLVKLAEVLQALYEGTLLKPDGTPYRKLMINMPPRHGKSFSLTRFCEWVIGKDNTNRVITISYNDDLSTKFSKNVRDSIETDTIRPSDFTFQDIFKTKIKHGDGSKKTWSLEDQFFNYLGSGFKGTITGVGCNIGIIDDPVKNKEEAYNETALEKHYSFYTDTFLSRLEEGAIQIINMTRWSENDLCGRILAKGDDDWYVLKMEAFDGENMLCPELLSYETYKDKEKVTSNDIFRANYHQETVDEEGKLYKTLQTYTNLPLGPVKSYTDTADTGDDYLCSVVYVEYNKQAYIIDVLYTQEGMEVTEPATANLHKRNNVNLAKIESNNGGRGFARNVERILKKELNHHSTVVTWFHQSGNKNSRILSQSYWVQQNVFFPVDWHIRWPEFYQAVNRYMKEGKNKHDDAPDTLTGIAEEINSNQGFVV